MQDKLTGTINPLSFEQLAAATGLEFSDTVTRSIRGNDLHSICPALLRARNNFSFDFGCGIPEAALQQEYVLSLIQRASLGLEKTKAEKIADIIDEASSHAYCQGAMRAPKFARKFVEETLGRIDQALLNLSDVNLNTSLQISSHAD